MIIKSLGTYVFVREYEVKGNAHCPGFAAVMGDELHVTEISPLSGRLGTLEFGWIASDLPVEHKKG